MVLPFHKYLWIAVIVAYISSGFSMKLLQDAKCEIQKRLELRENEKSQTESLVKVFLKVAGMVLLHSVHLKYEFLCWARECYIRIFNAGEKCFLIKF